jgi:hypothetical protein
MTNKIKKTAKKKTGCFIPGKNARPENANNCLPAETTSHRDDGLYLDKEPLDTFSGGANCNWQNSKKRRPDSTDRHGLV